MLISLMSPAVSCLHSSDSVVVHTMLVMDSLSCLVVSAVNALALRVSFLLIASATLFSIILHKSQDVRVSHNLAYSGLLMAELHMNSTGPAVNLKQQPYTAIQS